MTHYLSNNILLSLLLAICIIFTLGNSSFLTIGNLLNILNQISIIGIVSLGLTLVIILGGIDLSVGAIVALCGLVLAICQSSGIHLSASICICVITGTVSGTLNGILVTYARIPPFIATLGTMTAIRGIALALTDGRSISNFSSELNKFNEATFLLVPLPFLVLCFFSTILWSFLKYTYWGRYLYAIGGNQHAAWLAGINIQRYSLLVYLLSGFFCSLASILLVSKLNSAQPQAGSSYELVAIAAVVIGGASLSGGRGKIDKTLIGVMIIGVLQNGLSILNISFYYQQIVIGTILIAATVLDRFHIQKTLKSVKRD